MSATKPIPFKMREQMSSDPYYKKCCITGATNEKIDFHHNLTFKGQRVNQIFCILPLAKSVHDKISYYKELCNWVMWNRASEQEIKEYSKAENYQLTKERLNKRYGNYTEGRAKEYAEHIQVSM
jgi:hypothetical protein